MKRAFIKPLIPVSLVILSMSSQIAWSLGGPVIIQPKAIKPHSAFVATHPQLTAPIPTLPNNGCTLNTLAGNYVYDETSRESLAAEYGYAIDGGWVYNVTVGRENNDGHGNITGGVLITNSSYNNPTNDAPLIFPYIGTVTVNADCTGTYAITVTNPDGTTASGGGGPIFIDPKSGNFTLLDAHQLGSARFVKDSFSRPN